MLKFNVTQKAMSIMIAAAFLAAPAVNRAAGQDQTGAAAEEGVKALPGSFEGSLPAAYAGSCLLGDTQYTIQVGGQPPCGSTFTEISISAPPSVNLYVRFGAKVAMEAGQVRADYKSESQNSVKTVVLVPPYESGTYYIALTNCAPEPATFYLGFAIAVVDYFGPVIKNVSVKGKKLTVRGCYFNSEATIMMDGEEVETRYVDQDDIPALVNKNGAKKVAPGASVMLQVRDGNGRLSQPFVFKRPAD